MTEAPKAKHYRVVINDGLTIFVWADAITTTPDGSAFFSREGELVTALASGGWLFFMLEDEPTPAERVPPPEAMTFMYGEPY